MMAKKIVEPLDIIKVIPSLSIFSEGTVVS